MDTETTPELLEIATKLVEAVSAASGDQELVQAREQLDLAQRQLQVLRMEDQGWRLIHGNEVTEGGADLNLLKEMSELLRASVAESPLPKQANNLRASYTFSKPFLIPNLEGSVEAPEGPKKPGAKSAEERGQIALRKFAQSRAAREFVLGKDAQELISTACSTDGVYFLLGTDATKEVHAIQLSEITGVIEDPDFPGEVWAYQRSWTSRNAKGEDVPEKRWYYTDRYTGVRAKSFGTGADKVNVDTGKTMIELEVNKQLGWQWGIPDLWAGHVWSRNYLAGIKDGMEVTSLMAWFSAKVKQQSQSGANKTGVVVGNRERGAGVQSYGQGNSIDTYNTTGKAYDYDALRPIAAIYFLAAGVSVVDGLASPSAAGASYGSAQALAPGMRRSIEVRRDRIAAWMERVLEWATGTYHKVAPASIEETEPYRRLQMVTMAHNSGLFHPDEIRPEMAYLAGLTVKHTKHPDGYLPPNNEKSLNRKDIDADGAASKTTAPAPNQGQSDGTGGQGSTASSAANRTDTISDGGA